MSETLDTLDDICLDAGDRGVPVPTGPPDEASSQWAAALAASNAAVAAADTDPVWGAEKAAEALRLEQERIIGAPAGGLTGELLGYLAQTPGLDGRIRSVVSVFVVSRPRAAGALANAIADAPQDGLLWFLRGVLRYNRARQHRVPSARDRGLREAIYDLSMAVNLQAAAPGLARYFRANATMCLSDPDAPTRARSDLVAYVRSASADALHLPRAYRLLAYAAAAGGRAMLARRYYALGAKLAPHTEALWAPRLALPIPPYAVRDAEVDVWLSHFSGGAETGPGKGGLEDYGSPAYPAHVFLGALEADAPARAPEPSDTGDAGDVSAAGSELSLALDPVRPPVPPFPTALMTEDELIDGPAVGLAPAASAAPATAAAASSDDGLLLLSDDGLLLLTEDEAAELGADVELELELDDALGDEVVEPAGDDDGDSDVEFDESMLAAIEAERARDPGSPSSGSPSDALEDQVAELIAQTPVRKQAPPPLGHVQPLVVDSSSSDSPAPAPQVTVAVDAGLIGSSSDGDDDPAAEASPVPDSIAHLGLDETYNSIADLSKAAQALMLDSSSS